MFFYSKISVAEQIFLKYEVDCYLKFISIRIKDDFWIAKIIYYTYVFFSCNFHFCRCFDLRIILDAIPPKLT